MTCVSKHNFQVATIFNAADGHPFSFYGSLEISKETVEADFLIFMGYWVFHFSNGKFS